MAADRSFIFDIKWRKMDLKSLRERKAMLTESFALEKKNRKRPFTLEPCRLHAMSKGNLDALATSCKICKPISFDGVLESAMVVAALDFGHRVHVKQRIPGQINAEAKEVEQRREALPAVFKEADNLETKLRDQLLKTRTKQIKSDDRLCSHFNYTEVELQKSEMSQKCFNKVVTDARSLGKLLDGTRILRERLKKLPGQIRPGFQLNRQNLQALVDDRRIYLEELKRQVLEDSSF